jgi:UDP-N-acetylmuramoylalanine--D-glutamate ligase
MAAIAITRGLVSKETVREIATTFGGVEHRLELVREKDGIRFYNSSIDSSPTRTAAAISALPKAPIIILGGEDKNVPFDGLALDVCTRVKAAVVTGVSAPKILSAIENCPEYDPERVSVRHIDDFREAVLAAAEMAEEGDIVLLSPACTSFDHFKDFAHRGNYFKEIVRGL